MPPQGFHSQAADQLLLHLGVRADDGLSREEAARRLQQFGPNQIEGRKKIGALTILAHQLASPVVYLLGAAAVLAFVFGQSLEGAAVLVVLLLNTLVGYVTETKAIRSMQALRSLGHRSARVRRDGAMQIVRAQNLVPGDIVLAEGGDVISADLRLLSTSNLSADESTLTGESVPVEKSADAVAEQARLADRTAMLFKGTSVTRGTATGVVVATGLSTELGRISQLLEAASPARSPLEQRLAGVAGQLVWLTLIVTGLIVAAGLLRGTDPVLIVETGIALAVAAIPEGLPVVATMVLAQGMWRMARKNALIERLSAVETFGSTSLILTDKTGTLTQNRMSVARVCLPSAVPEPRDFMEASADPAIAQGLSRLLMIGSLCNSSELTDSNDGGIGDPMELALLQAADTAGLDRADWLARQPMVRERAFDNATRLMATVHQSEEEGFLFAVKGAPEEVLAQATSMRLADGDVPLGAAQRAQWRGVIDDLAGDGMRVLAMACKLARDADEEPYAQLVLLGMVGLMDPPRADVRDVIAACKAAGVDVAIVTGDHAITANAIGREVGLAVDGAEPIEGHMLAEAVLDPAKLRSTKVFARVNPDEKLALVKAFQDLGEVVAMTGDGVNDGPALRQADIGVAMGKRGTDVAREAADMVLLDDAFATIVVAIREGRIIFENIRRFASYLLACNLSEVLVVGLAVLLSLPLPILPLQILFLNLVTDVFPAFALAMAKGDDAVMRRTPRPADEALLGRAQWRRIVLHGLSLTGATFGAMVLAVEVLQIEGEAMITVTFLTLAFSQLWQVFNMRHPQSGMIRNEIVCNWWVWAALGFCTLLLLAALYVPSLADLLGLVPPDRAMWAVVMGMSFAPVALIQAVALARRALVAEGKRSG